MNLKTNNGDYHWFIQGDDWRHAIYRKLGSLEVTDTIHVTKYMQDNLSYIDRNKTGNKHSFRLLHLKCETKSKSLKMTSYKTNDQW